jgi:hypothetical protein
MSSKKIGALIVIGRQSLLGLYADRGQKIEAEISADLLETIFFKNTPLHDGAVLIENRQILAARCPLPVTDQYALSSISVCVTGPHWVSPNILMPLSWSFLKKPVVYRLQTPERSAKTLNPMS